MAGQSSSAIRDQIIQGALKEIHGYAHRYNCTLKDAFDDYIAEAPLESWLSESLESALGTSAKHHYSQSECDQYIRERLV